MIELCNPITKKWIDLFVARPQTSLIIDSPNDSFFGLEIAKEINQKISANNPLIVIDKKDKKSLGIDVIRDLKNTLKLSANKTNDVSRIVVINEAEYLTNESQNSLLKILEELPARTIIILVVSDRKSILDTILSRCFIVPVLPISKEQANSYAEVNSISAEDSNKAYLMSDGVAGMYLDIVKSNTSEIEDDVSLAKNFITSDVVKRQNIIKDLLKNDQLGSLLVGIKITARTGMRLSQSGDSKNKWKLILKEALHVEDLLNNNVSTKLAALQLTVSV